MGLVCCLAGHTIRRIKAWRQLLFFKCIGGVRCHGNCHNNKKEAKFHIKAYHGWLFRLTVGLGAGKFFDGFKACFHSKSNG